VIVVPVALVTAAALTTLLTFVDVSTEQNRIDIIKTGLTVGAGTGGVVALVLNGRRQWSTEHDATQRRLTDLYVKAVEQLGSDKAAVRHGGIYALERVAQDNPNQRQTIIDVLCAYLRAPYTASGVRSARRLGINRPLAASKNRPISAQQSHSDDEAYQEREVRLTAQRMLTRHLRPGDSKHPNGSYWANIDLDLTAATLIDFDLNSCKIRRARFDRAFFINAARFDDITFTGTASFGSAAFTGIALFDDATFTSNAMFGGVTFINDAKFDRVTFTAFARFQNATFAKEAWFGNATFTESALFDRAIFTDWSSFQDTTFAKDTRFCDTTFSKHARFVRATFTKAAKFDRARFDARAWLTTAPSPRPPGSSTPRSPRPSGSVTSPLSTTPGSTWPPSPRPPGLLTSPSPTGPRSKK
jgi:hypothetical protein